MGFIWGQSGQVRLSLCLRLDFPKKKKSKNIKMLATVRSGWWVQGFVLRSKWNPSWERGALVLVTSTLCVGPTSGVAPVPRGDLRSLSFSMAKIGHIATPDASLRSPYLPVVRWHLGRWSQDGAVPQQGSGGAPAVARPDSGCAVGPRELAWGGAGGGTP